MQLRSLVSETYAGPVSVFSQRGGTTLSFDLRPLAVENPGGLDLHFNVYKVPGKTGHNDIRKAVLARADGVIFVADSRIEARRGNAAAFQELESNLAAIGESFTTMPLVVQYNKRDLDDVVCEGDAQDLWEPSGVPVTFASALFGCGVVETFACALPRVLAHASVRFGLGTRGFQPERFWLELVKRFWIAVGLRANRGAVS